MFYFPKKNIASPISSQAVSGRFQEWKLVGKGCLYLGQTGIVEKDGCLVSWFVKRNQTLFNKK